MPSLPHKRTALYAAASAFCLIISACGGGGGGSSSGSGGGISSSGSSSSSSSSASSSSASSSSASLSGPLASYSLSGATDFVHDPSIIKQGSTYYVFHTDKSATEGGFVEIRCSADKIAWTRCGFVFATMPSWVNGIVPNATLTWAPDISYFNGKYHLYYSVSTFGSNISAIGLATSTTLDPTDPAYGWQDQGMVLRSGPGDTFNAIDPNIFADSDGKVYFTYGSFWNGIYQREVDPATGLLKAGAATHLAQRAPSVTYNPIEGPSLVKRGSYYYLFTAWDFCCESNPANNTYKITVGRSTSPTGPFTDKTGTALTAGGGTLLLEGNSLYSGPGGQHVYLSGSEDLIVFHARRLSQNGLPYLFIKNLNWVDDWPVIAD